MVCKNDNLDNNFLSPFSTLLAEAEKSESESESESESGKVSELVILASTLVEELKLANNSL